MGFRQSSLLVVVGLMALEDTLDYRDVIHLAGLRRAICWPKPAQRRRPASRRR